jgi:SAM-dependent methyltransferase
MTDSYALDNTEGEQVRLSRQSVALGPITERLFRSAGIGAGMSVLDVGCGIGDVSAIAAELVSSSGRVVGFDRDARQVAVAKARFAEHANVSVVEATIEDPPDGQFDAIVGRLVLMYQPDIAAAVASLARRLRSGGVVAFIEINLRPDGTQMIYWPQTPLDEEIRGWVLRGFGSASHFVGLQLPSMFRRAGLVPQPPYDSTAIIYEGRDRVEMSTEIVRSMLPSLTAVGISPEDIDIDTLADRLYAEAGDEQICALGPIIGVCARKPN